MKYFKTILVVILLAGLPLGSWYFLKSGLEWRKAKVVDLEKKEIFLKAIGFSVDDKNKLYEIMAHRTNVVKKRGALSANDEAIIDQFEDAYTFQFLSLDGNEADPKGGWTSKSVVRFYSPDNISSNSTQIKDWDYMLVDTSGFIRQYYLGEDKQVMKLLVEDIAVILPRKKEKDIILKGN